MIKLFKTVYQYADRKVKRTYKTQVALGLIWFLVDYGFAFSLQLFFQSAKLLPDNSNYIDLINNFKDSLWMTSTILVVTSGLRFLIQSFKTYNNQSIYEYMVANLRRRLIHRVTSTENSFNSHQILSYFNDNITGMSTFLSLSSNSLLLVISSLLLTAACLKISISLTFVAITSIFLFYLPLRLTNKTINLFGQKYQKHYDEIYKNIVISIKNITYLSILNKVESEFEKGNKHIQLYAQNASAYYFLYGIKSAFPFFVGIVTITSIVLISKKFDLINPSNLLAFSYLFIRICQNLGEINASLSDMRRLSTEVRRGQAWLTEPIEKRQNFIQKKSFNEKINTLEVSNLAFKFPDAEKSLFSALSFSLKTGQTLLIKGRSGAGKSTLLKILLGHIEPTKGFAAINGKNILEITNDVSKKTGYVGPDNYFIVGTLKENLLYLNEKTGITDQIIKDALKLVGLDFLTEKLELEVNDNLELSTGQKQRLSLARAILREPDLIILDEATANLDSETENAIIDQLKILKSEKIMIIISHKDTFNSLADMTINFNNLG